MAHSQVASPKQQEQFDEFASARQAQGYDVRRPSCGNCAHLISEQKLVGGNRPWNRYEVTSVHANPRCGIGGFAVLLTAACRMFDRRTHQLTTTE